MFAQNVQDVFACLLLQMQRSNRKRKLFHSFDTQKLQIKKLRIKHINIFKLGIVASKIIEHKTNKRTKRIAQKRSNPVERTRYQCVKRKIIT